MAEQTACEVATFAVSDIRTLILLLASPETTICIGSIEALTKYAESATKNRLQLLSLNVLDHLISLARSPDVNVKKAAIGCIAAASELTVDFHPQLRRADLLCLLLALLDPSEVPEVQDEATFALSNLARDYATKSAIRKAGGIRALVVLLESQDPDVKKNAALALTSMLEDFASRLEVRQFNGLASLLELLASEFREIQENALTSLIRCAEDQGNRVEIRKLNGILRMIDFLNQDTSGLQHLTLLCLANCLEDPETGNIFHELGGTAALVKMADSEDVRLKRHADLALARAARNEKNQSYIREAGALPILMAHLSHADAGVISHAAMTLVNLAKNEINQLELSKAGAVEVLIQHLSHEDLDVNRQCVAALSSLCTNVKVRPKARQHDGVPAVIRLLNLDDGQTLVNACDCLSILMEDSAMRAEVVKLQGVHSLAMVLQKSDVKIQATSALALARCLQDEECRIAFSREPAGAGLSRLIDLLGSKDIYVCRNASYAIANAAQYEPVAILATKTGAIEALINLSNDPMKNSHRFALDALDKLLDHHLCAKYWLQNTLSDRNFISDNFYDFGAAGPNPDPQHPFPSIEELQSLPVDKRREVLLIDTAHDGYLNALVQLAGSGPLSARTPRQQLRQIASIVSQVMGGPVDPTRLQDMAYKFKITELKMKLHSNVIPLGQITQGTFYHRALLFKFICDKLGLTPCTLVRGEYGRAWTIVDPTRQNLKVARAQTPTPAAVPAPTAPAATKPEKPTSASRNRHAQAAANSNKQDAENATASGGMAGAATATPSTSAIPATIVPVSVPQPVDDDESYLVEECIVDLMFEPGRLLPLGSPEAESYQRFT